MAELFDYKQDHWSPELRSLGFHLGKFIYLMDATTIWPAINEKAPTIPSKP